MVNKEQSYDIIGDVHGHASELTELLSKLGYWRARGSGWRHDAGRKVIFLGDLINHGPKVRETLLMVREMVGSGTARVILGNHELNALCFAFPDGHGGFLRKHSEENIFQHEATLRDFAGRAGEWGLMLDWFFTLPLFLDLKGLRLVHACWDKRAIHLLRGKNHLTMNMLHGWSRGDVKTQEAVHLLLKGPEVPLPKKCHYLDEEGRRRNDIRVKWWIKSRSITYRLAAITGGDRFPDEKIPREYVGRMGGYGAAEVPVLFGHYGFIKPPEPLADNVACVDLGIVRGGYLAAYRWDGENVLNRDKFSVQR